MQTRYFDRGTVYDFNFWRTLLRGVLAPGVYHGFDLAVDPNGNITAGTTHSVDDPGVYLLPTGVGVSEDRSVTIQITLPGSAQDITLLVKHVDTGLVAGVAATYYSSNSLIETQPADGVILGWIRYDGSGSITDAMVTPAPLQRADEIDQTTEARTSVIGSPPDLVIEYGSGAQVAQGLETGDTPPWAWRGVTNPVTVFDVVSVGLFQWRVRSEPYRILIRSVIEAGARLDVEVLDTAGTVLGGVTSLVNNFTLTENEILVPQSTGVWAEEGVGTVRLTYVTPQATNIKIHRLLVDNWPFAISST